MLAVQLYGATDTDAVSGEGREPEDKADGAVRRMERVKSGNSHTLLCLSTKGHKWKKVIKSETKEKNDFFC